MLYQSIVPNCDHTRLPHYSRDENWLGYKSINIFQQRCALFDAPFFEMSCKIPININTWSTGNWMFYYDWLQHRVAESI